MFGISGFLGFEATAIFRSEAKDPDRTIGRATYGALAIVGIFYAVRPTHGGNIAETKRARARICGGRKRSVGSCVGIRVGLFSRARETTTTRLET